MLSVPGYFSGKNVFITGGSGFIGKVLIEKLLRSCPDIGKIYVLIRSKRGKSPLERLRQIIDNPLFDILRDISPSALNKVEVIPGNIQELRFGLSEEHEKLLTSQIHIIYHCAAEVNFDIPLKSAILTNVKCARELSNFAIRCTALEAFVFISTMYSNCDQDVIDEKVYRTKLDWRELIALAEDDNLTRSLEVMTQKTIDPFPNTYTFSKKMAEQVFADLCQDKVPLIICRPSIVIFTLKEPLVGWADNLNGPWAILLMAAKGISDVVYGDPETRLDKVFVDNVVKTIIVATWQKSLSENKMDVEVYNICTDISWKVKYYADVKYDMLWNLPSEGRIAWCGRADLIASWYYYYFWLIFNNVIPALFLDVILKLGGKKPIVFRYLKKIYLANVHLKYFMNRTFTFHNDGYRTIEDKLLESDKADFTFRHDIPDVDKDPCPLARTALIGMKKYVFHEKWPIASETFANTKKFYAVSIIVLWLKIFIICYVLFWKWNLHARMWNKMFSYVESL